MSPRPTNLLTRLPAIAILAILFISCERPPESAFGHPSWSRNATIYEVNVRQFTPEGTFRTLEEHLPRLQKMGIKILWLMPIQPIGELNRKGSLGSYYSIRDYLAVNPEFGTGEDFRKLVEKAHNLGMYVILDWVANHTSWDNPLIIEHPEWYKKDSTGAIIPPVPDWSDVAALDYDNPDLRTYMTNALLYWVREYGIDGYRCDVAGMLPVDFWNAAVPELKKLKHVFMLAEWETPEMHDTAFDATYSWDFHHLMNQIAQGKKTADQIDTLYNKEKTTYPPHAYRMRFTTNHDENSWNGTEWERMGDAANTFAVLTFTFPGIPMLYTGQEAAMNKRLRFFDKDTVSWGDYPLESFYAKLISLKLGNDLLDAGDQGGAYLKVPSSNDQAVCAFLREKGNHRVLTLLNLSQEPQTVKLLGTDFTGTYTELFSNEPKALKQDQELYLKPWEYLIFCR